MTDQTTNPARVSAQADATTSHTPATRPFWEDRHVDVSARRNWLFLYSTEATRCQPDQDYLDKGMLLVGTKDDALPLVIGGLSLTLATLVATLDATYGATCPRDSISHYFYAPIAGSAFIIILGFIAAFMFAYRGQSRWDGWITTIGAFGAIGTAAFPTTGLGCPDGQLFDLKLIQNSAVILESGRYYAAQMPEIDTLGSQIVGRFTEAITIFDTEQATAANDVTQITTYTIANKTSQSVHQISAAVLIGSLIVLSIRHLLRCNWVVYNARSDTYLIRKVQWGETFATGIAVFFMIIGGVMAAGLFPAIAETASLIVARLGVIGYWLSGADYSAVPRPVFHGELVALVAFGAAWITQWIFYFRFTRKFAGAQVNDAIAERNHKYQDTIRSGAK
ncbi:hypothetical protein SLH49_06040 [Cognatiyoonia sp. IB215446]|uniref:hypothetical protein n=1 Tax=Cognatiyoonia sp. IB215446 TaxID=3097355 RepID=UPI002A10F22A|nr:hypothetical protein [Cognatiyoonia sp. IB215446]MDX8347543.1 hypothetical protein [Cognatiyoonia sp. IB215446]